MAKQFCPECGTHFQPTHPLALFCCAEHKRAWNNRNNVQGAPLVILLKAWREGRHMRGDPIGKIALNELCLAVDRMLAEDRAAGRPKSADLLKARLRRQGLGGLLRRDAA